MMGCHRVRDVSMLPALDRATAAAELGVKQPAGAFSPVRSHGSESREVKGGARAGAALAQ